MENLFFVQSYVRNLFKINKKDTKAMSLTSLLMMNYDDDDDDEQLTLSNFIVLVFPLLTFIK